MTDEKEEMVDVLQFTCPTCGSHQFGHRFCSGWFKSTDASGEVTTTRCTFKWTEQTEHLYFHPTGRKQKKYDTGTMVLRPTLPPLRQRIILETADGRLVSNEHMILYGNGVQPTVVLWGTRVFVRDMRRLPVQNRKDMAPHYRECVYATLPNKPGTLDPM